MSNQIKPSENSICASEHENTKSKLIKC